MFYTYLVTFLFAININAKFITADAMGSIYIVDQDNTLIKCDSTGKELFRYSNKTYGNISTVDVFNPLKPLVYYSSLRNIVILDNTLSPINEVKLRDKMLLLVPSVCRSSDNNIWLIDIQSLTLKKIDESGNLLKESPDIIQTLGYVPLVQYMTQEDQKIYISDTSKGLIIFDEYGNYEKTLPLKGIRRFQLYHQNIVYTLNDTLHSFDLRTFDKGVYDLKNAKPFNQALISGNTLVALSKNEVNLYRLK